MPPYPPWPLALSLALVRVLIVLAICFVGVPLMLFPEFDDSESDAFAGRASLFMFLVLAIAHGLALAGLYEGLVVLSALLAAAVWRYYLSLAPSRRAELRKRFGVGALNLIDRLTGHPSATRQQAAARQPSPAYGRHRPRRPAPARQSRLPAQWPAWVLLAAIVGVAAWMRYASGYAHPAPAYSDAPVTLKWMKDFGMNRIYSDGVYTQGLYAFLALVKKLSMETSVLVMYAMGPLVGVFMVLSVAGYVRWSTGSNLAAAAAALLYGTLPSLLPAEFNRQAGYNSQEFAVVFVLPAAWFAYRYLAEGRRRYGGAAAAAAGVVAFTHPMPSMIAVSALAAVVVAAVTSRFTTAARVVRLTIWCAVAGLIAVTSPLLGLTVMHRPWHSTTIAFLDDKGAPFPGLPPWYALALLGGAALAPLLVRERRTALWTAVLVMLAALGAWYLPFFVEPLRTFGYRSMEGGALALGIAAGLVWHSLQCVAPRPFRSTLGGAIILAGLAGFAWYRWPPPIANPPRISNDEAIVQFLRFDRFHRPGDWMVVMDEPGYPLALGRGEHQYPADFVQNVRASSTMWCWQEKDGSLTRGPRTAGLFLDRQSPSYPALQKWVDEHRQSLPLTLAYQGKTLDVWLLEYPIDPKDEFARAWGVAGQGCDVSQLGDN